MDNPRPEKVAVVAEVKSRMDGAQAVLLTEYRGLDVASMSALRRRLREAGGEYSVYKNTLVRFAARELGLDLEELLVGPIALAIVPSEGGDPVTVAKALRDFAKENEALVIKGGVLGDKVLSAADADALADVAPREVLLAQLAGAMAAPMQQFAGLLQALPRNFAYGLKALIDQGGAPGAPAAPAEPAPDEAPAAAAEAATEVDDTPSTETPEAEAASEPTETPEAEAAPAEES